MPPAICSASFAVRNASSDPYTVLIHSAPGRAVVIHPATGREGAAFIFRHPLLAADARKDPWKQKQLLTATYGSMSWRVPEMLDRVRASDDVYFDSITRVAMECWSQGRVVLIGDAADCISLLGEGSSMAIVGAATLAEHLTTQPTDTPVALRCYEQVHRRRLRPHHRGASIAGRLLVPETRAGLAIRDAALRTYATADAARKRIHSRTPTP